MNSFANDESETIVVCDFMYHKRHTDLVKIC